MSTLWIGPDPLVLASGSVARLALLAAAAIPVEVRPAAIDERTIDAPLRRAGAAPAAIAAHLARAKALAVSTAHPGRLVLGADQTLALGTHQFSKPVSLEEARSQLGRLSGATHSLHSAWTLARDAAVVTEGLDEARMTMRVVTPAFLDAYLALAGDDVCASVGGYQLEGLGPHLFATIAGDHATILGLPLLQVLAALRQAGYLLG